MRGLRLEGWSACGLWMVGGVGGEVVRRRSRLGEERRSTCVAFLRSAFRRCHNSSGAESCYEVNNLVGMLADLTVSF